MLKTFKTGGIHPPENKLSRNKAIENIPLPKQVVVFLSQHLGVPAVPVVQKGDDDAVYILHGQFPQIFAQELWVVIGGKQVDCVPLRGRRAVQGAEHIHIIQVGEGRDEKRNGLSGFGTHAARNRAGGIIQFLYRLLHLNACGFFQRVRHIQKTGYTGNRYPRMFRNIFDFDHSTLTPFLFRN